MMMMMQRERIENEPIEGSNDGQCQSEIGEERTERGLSTTETRVRTYHLPDTCECARREKVTIG